jgi:DNA-binding beta-propeller fold protein YncE
VRLSELSESAGCTKASYPVKHGFPRVPDDCADLDAVIPCRSMSSRRPVAMSMSLVALVVACTGQMAPEPAPTPRETAAETLDLRPAWVARWTAGPKYRVGSVADLVLSPDGATAFVSGQIDIGHLWRSPGCTNVATAAYDTADGTSLWKATYDGPEHWCDDVYGTSLSPDATKLIVTGSSHGPLGDLDSATVAYDASDGTELWVARQDGPISAQDNGEDVVSTGKSVFVIGDVTRCVQETSTCYSPKMTTIAYNATSGRRRWLAQYAMDGESVVPGQIVASPDGKSIFVTAFAGLDAVTIAYTASTGAERWVVRDRPVAGLAPATAAFSPADLVGRSADGRTLFVAGGVGGSRHGVAAYAARDGAKLWTLETSRSPWSWPMVVPSSTRDVVFLADRSRTDYLVIAIDARTGRELWRSTYDGACDHSDDTPTAMAVSPDGSRVYVTGYTERRGEGVPCPPFGTIALDAADGGRLWTAAFENDATEIAVGADGAVYLAGQFRSGFFTLRFDPRSA